MKCPRCSFVGSDYVGACKKCGNDLAEARQALGLPPLGRRPLRASTSILDGPVEPSLIDEAPAPTVAGPRTLLDFEEAPVEAKPETDHLDTMEENAGEDFRADAEEDSGNGGSHAGSGFGGLSETAPVEPSEIDIPEPDPFMPPPGASNGHGTPLELDLAPMPNGHPLEAASELAQPDQDWERPDVHDFGEPLDLDESHITASPAPALNEGGWPQDSWETGVAPEVPRTAWAGSDDEPAREADPEALPKGGFWMRLVAYLVDRLFLSLIAAAALFALLAWTGALGAILDHLPEPGANPEAVSRELGNALYPYGESVGGGFVVISLLTLLYRPLCHWLWGKTIGKKLLGLRVVTTNATPLGLLRACVRELGFLLSCLPFGLGLLWVVWSRQKQGWHDMIAGTYVLKENA